MQVTGSRPVMWSGQQETRSDYCVYCCCSNYQFNLSVDEAAGRRRSLWPLNAEVELKLAASGDALAANLIFYNSRTE